MRFVKIKTIEEMLKCGYEVATDKSLQNNKNFGFWMEEMEAGLDDSRIIGIDVDGTWVKDFCEYYISTDMIEREANEGE